jgi:signal transduction histidine kinase
MSVADPVPKKRSAGLWIATVAGLAIILVGAGASLFIDNRVERLLQSDTFATLADEQATIADIYLYEGSSGVSRTITRLSRSPDQTRALYLLKTSDEKILASQLLSNQLPEEAMISGRSEFQMIGAGGETLQIDALTRTLPDGSMLLVGRANKARLGLRNALSAAFLATLAAVGLSALGLGLVLERILRHRVDVIARAAASISEGDLVQRIPVSGRGDEFDRLADVLNAMLEQIETQIVTMRTVTDSFAHDLRLPLTRIRAGIEQAALADNAEQRNDALERALIGTDRALSTFTTLLEIARADSGVGRDAFALIDLCQIAQDVVEVFAPLAEEHGQTLSFLPDAHLQVKIWGQSTLLRQALGNLVYNAIKYAGDGTPISVNVTLINPNISNGLAEVSVFDEGPGIPIDQRERALQPFGRLKSEGTIDGTGLGLALAAATARLHNGTLELADQKPGLRVTLHLPLPTPEISQI